MKPNQRNSVIFRDVNIFPAYADIISLAVQKNFEQLTIDGLHLGFVVQNLVTEIRNGFEEYRVKNYDSGKSEQELVDEFATNYVDSLQFNEESITGRYLTTQGRANIALSVKHVIWNDVQPMYYEIQNPKFAKRFIDEAAKILRSRQASAGSEG